MSQTSTEASARSAKKLAAAFFEAAGKIDEAQRLPVILAAVGQIVSNTKMLPRPAGPAASRRPKAVKATLAKKASTKSAKAAAGAKGTRRTAVPAGAVIIKPMSQRRTLKSKPPLKRAATVDAGNGASVAA